MKKMEKKLINFLIIASAIIITLVVFNIQYTTITNLKEEVTILKQNV